MATLTWDQIGERIFQTGVDHGVLYLQDGTAVVWNGLTSVEETTSSEVQDFFLDGVKYLQNLSPRDFRAKLKAFTYPDEFDSVNGIVETSGLIYYDQPSQSFSLSYRTKIGNDVDGIEYGYKIHILYNIIANPDSYGFDSLDDSSAKPTEFGWTLSGIPQKISNFKPTVHVALDSTKVVPSRMSAIEDILYGTEEKAPYLPSLLELAAFFGGGGPIVSGNLLSNPGFEVNWISWDYYVQTGATLLDFSVSPKWSKFGLMSGHFKWQNANDSTLRSGTISTNISSITPNVPYTASVYIDVIDPSSHTADNLFLTLNWYNVNDVLIGSSTSQAYDDASITAGTRLSVSGIAPENTYRAVLQIQSSTDVASDVIEYYIDSAQFEIGETASEYTEEQPPVRNLLPNPNFNNGLSGWNNYVLGGTVDDFSASEQWSKFGSRSLHFKWHSPDSTNRSAYVYSNDGVNGIPVIPGVPYTASVYLKTVDPTSNPASGYTLHINWFNAAGTQVGSGTPINTLADEGVDGVRLSVTGTAPDTAISASVSLQTTLTAAETNEYYLSNAQFETGATATPYTEAVIPTENLIPNPSFETSLDGWTNWNNSGGTVNDFSVSTDWSVHGTKSLHFKWTNGNDTSSRWLYILTLIGTAGIPVQPKTYYTLSISVKTVNPSSATGLEGYYLQIIWSDSNGDAIGSAIQTQFLDENVNGARLVMGACSPPNAAYARVGIVQHTNVANDVIEFYADAVQFEIGPIVTPYTDVVIPPPPVVLDANFTYTIS